MCPSRRDVILDSSTSAETLRATVKGSAQTVGADMQFDIHSADCQIPSLARETCLWQFLWHRCFACLCLFSGHAVTSVMFQATFIEVLQTSAS